MTARCTGEVPSADMRQAPIQYRGSSSHDPRPQARATTRVVPGFTSTKLSTYGPGSPKGGLVHRLEEVPSCIERWLFFEFQVQDTGSGIPAHLHSKIFEPFMQGDSGLNKTYAGTGLGLSICAQIASVMGGSISMQSELGYGSTFVFSVPLKLADGDSEGSVASVLPTHSKSIYEWSRHQPSGFALSMRQAQAIPGAIPDMQSMLDTVANAKALSHPEVGNSAGLEKSPLFSGPASEIAIPQAGPLALAGTSVMKHPRKLKILVAEDNKTNQIVIQRMLKLEGTLDVTIAVNGQDALGKVKKALQNGEPYDLVFMDVQMPVLDGIEATKQIRQLKFTGPIIALTAYTEVQLLSTMNCFVADFE